MRERTIAGILFVTLALAYAFVFPRWLDCCESRRRLTSLPARHFR